MSDLVIEAEKRQRVAADLLERAVTLLRDAQNQITDVEAEGSSVVYEQIADAYESVANIRRKLLAMKPTGIFG